MLFYSAMKMRVSSVFIIFFGVGIGSVSSLLQYSAQAHSLCGEALHAPFALPDEAAKLFLRMKDKVAGDPTFLRVEKKFTVDEKIWNAGEKHLKDIFGDRLGARDVRQDSDYTVTDYDNKFVQGLSTDSDFIKGGFRVRHYVNQSEVAEGISTAVEKQKNSWAEFKFTFQGVVYKFRLFIPDSLLAILMAGNVDPKIKNIIKSELKLKPENQLNLVDDFIDLFCLTYPKGTTFKFRNLYSRKSSRVKVHSKSGADVVVILTADQNIRMSYYQGALIRAYPANARVVEVKVTPSHSKLTAADLEDAPELRSIEQLIQLLANSMLPGFSIGVGKFDSTVGTLRVLPKH